MRTAAQTAYSPTELDEIKFTYPEGTLHKVPAGSCRLLTEWRAEFFSVAGLSAAGWCDYLIDAHASR